MCSAHEFPLGLRDDIFFPIDKKRNLDNTVFNCRKEVVGKNYLKRKCGWTGVLSDLVSHIRTDHKENYFIADTGKLMFKWQLPSYGDREDFGIIHTHNNYFFYSLYYSEKMKELAITIWNIVGDGQNCGYYQATLCDNHKIRPYTGKVNDVRNAMNTDNYVPMSIILQTDHIESYCDEYRIFKFSLCIF